MFNEAHEIQNRPFVSANGDFILFVDKLPIKQIGRTNQFRFDKNNLVRVGVAENQIKIKMALQYAEK